MEPGRSGKSDDPKLLDDWKREFLRFATSYAEAVKSGANEAGRQILDSAPDANHPTHIPAGKLFAAVKAGIGHAGKQLIGFGMEYFKQKKDDE